MSEWETVGSKALSTSKMAIGDSFEGTFLALKENTTSQFEKKDSEGNIVKQYNLVMKNTAGEEVTVFSSGTLNYKISDGVFEAGRTYKITRLENKKGIKAGQFLVQVKKADGALSNGAPGVNATVPKGKAATTSKNA